MASRSLQPLVSGKMRLQGFDESSVSFAPRPIVLDITHPFGIRFTLTPESGRADIETRVRMENSRTGW